MKKQILVLSLWMLCHDSVCAQEALVHVDTLGYRSLDVVSERLVLQERVAEDTLTVVPFTALTAYYLFSPSVTFPGSRVERMSNGFPVVIAGDTFCMTVPSCDDDACTSRLFADYQGFPLVPLNPVGDCAFVPGIKDTNDARIVVEGLGRAGESQLLRVTVCGYAMSTASPELRTKYDPGYVMISAANAYYTRYLSGAPVFGPDGSRLIGIVSGITYRQVGEDIVEVRLVITFFS